jgi:enoyl-CoA hydratase
MENNEIMTCSAIQIDHFFVDVLTFRRSQCHNAINREVVDAMHGMLPSLAMRARSGDIRAVIIAGEGSSFCSGGDLKLLSGRSPIEIESFMRDATMAFRALGSLPVPVIAKVQGACIGGGFELALHCDFIVCQSNTVFGFPEVNHGWTTTAGSVARVVDAVGSSRAKALLLGLRTMNAQDAYACGLAHVLASHDNIDEEVDGICRKFFEMPTEGVAAMKQLLHDHSDPMASASWHRELNVFRELLNRSEHTG